MSTTGVLCFSWISLAKTAVMLSLFRLSTGVMVNRNTRTCRNTIFRLYEIQISHQQTCPVLVPAQRVGDTPMVLAM